MGVPFRSRLAGLPRDQQAQAQSGAVSIGTDPFVFLGYPQSFIKAALSVSVLEPHMALDSSMFIPLEPVRC